MAQILRRAKARKALLLFGNEASFPQWGTLTYTWARRGRAQVKDLGKRRPIEITRVIEYFTGRLFYQGQEGRPSTLQRTLPFSQGPGANLPAIILIQDGARYHSTETFFTQHAARLQDRPAADLFTGL